MISKKLSNPEKICTRMDPTCTLSLSEIKKDSDDLSKPLTLLAGATRLELATSGVTGRRSNQTELRPRNFLFPRTFEQGVIQTILKLAIFPLEKRDVLTKLSYAPYTF